ncbi:MULTISPECIES: tRNA (adenosine(37)-N6)-threonylcarbamoyltransferase complex ATPase subunit type 1 TsaE [Candidatus Ichthyocystis]|uniref:tRNA threonylcarbamoyladenosine biosynthesis protein TsaE n=1 Tax=Candidatus Ichthyocystis hellenicum TaxID=1561003 RepID=A0A0S4M748_9BURK|nr:MULTISPECIES: tRNA (adenosine(37)-N6)-threonylcarbamoyltransferase complex ATPase subunit type 1 TsaE [Ichthyocystis]CUT18102.1 putative tRNA threonylcarbamoyladenosine biosynthesis protein TsaE [Candidatus Ichthyocystis hellenicum]
MNTTTATYNLPEPSATRRWGEKLATALGKCHHFITEGTIIYLSGTLGSGKTTIVQGLFHSLGVSDTISSPTFSLVHTYDTGSIKAFHVDLYRLSNPLATSILDLDTYHRKPQHIVAIEWPENGVPLIPPADIEINMEDHEEGRILTMSVKNRSLEEIFLELSNNYNWNQ